MDIEKKNILFYGLWFLFSGFSNYILFLLFLCNFLFIFIFKILKLHNIITPNKDIITILFYIFVNITFWVMDIGSKLIKAFDKKEPIYRKIQLLFSIFLLCIGSLIILYDYKSSLSSLLTLLQGKNKIKNFFKFITIFLGPIGIGIGMYFFIKMLVSYEIKEDIPYKSINDIITLLIFFILLVPYPLYIIVSGKRLSNKEKILFAFIVLCVLIGFIIYIYYTFFSNNKDEDKNISDDTSDEDNDENNNEDGDNVDEDTECDIAITTD